MKKSNQINQRQQTGGIISFTHSVDCHLAVYFGERPYYTQSGYKTWSDYDIKWYEEAQKDKTELINSSVVAQSLSDLGSSTWILKAMQICWIIFVPQVTLIVTIRFAHHLLWFLFNCLKL